MSPRPLRWEGKNELSGPGKRVVMMAEVMDETRFSRSTAADVRYALLCAETLSDWDLDPEGATYMNFLQLAIGEAELTREAVREHLLTGDGASVLAAISTGAVFFGAMTYIGNGPNFMVRAIADSAGVRMPSFTGYLWRAGLLLLPVLVLHWALRLA